MVQNYILCRWFLLLCLVFSGFIAEAALAPTPAKPARKKVQHIIRKKIYDWFLHKKIVKSLRSKKADDAKTARLLGIIALISMIVPVFGIFSIALAIIAIVKGKAILKDDPGNKDAQMAVKFGWIALAVFGAFIVIFGGLVLLGLLI